jgi:hypothetical protein
MNEGSTFTGLSERLASNNYYQSIQKHLGIDGEVTSTHLNTRNA